MSVLTGLLIFIISVILIFLLVVRYRINTVIVLIGAALLYGLLSGLPLNDILNTMRSGFGATAGYIGIVLLEGVVMGVILEKTGALSVFASAVIKKSGKRNSELVSSIAGYTVSIPVSADSAFILLHPLAESTAVSAGRSIASVSVALAAGLYVSHSLILPTPGPLSAAGILNAGGVKVFLLGTVVSLPALAAVYFWSVMFVAKKDYKPVFDEPVIKPQRPYLEEPSLIESVIPLAVTIILMIFRAAAIIPARPFGGGLFMKFITFAGDPVSALFIGIICSLILVKKGFFMDALGNWISEGVKRATPVLILAAAGGAFGAVIKASPLTNSVIAALCTWKIGILLPFIVAAVLKTATGSSTISMISAASVVSPLAGSMGIDPALAVLAAGSGAMLVSHVNDPLFWIVAKMSGMDESAALRFFTPVTAIAGCVSFVVTAFLSLFM